MLLERTCYRSHIAATGCVVGFLISMVLAASAAAGSPITSFSSDQPETQTVEKTPESVAESLAKSEQRIAQRRERAESLLARAGSQSRPTAQLGRLRAELEGLKFLEFLYAQHRDELSHAEELKATEKQLQQTRQDLRLAGLGEAKPYSILLQDQFLDELESETTRAKSLGFERDAAKEQLRSALRMHSEAETLRRRAQERLELAANAADRNRWLDELTQANLKSELFSEMVELRRLEIQNAEKAHANSKLRVEYFTEKQNAILGQVVFTKEHLQTVLGQLDTQEQTLRSQLLQLQSRVRELDQQAREAQQQTAVETPNTQLKKEMEAGWEQAKSSYRTQVHLLHQRIRDLVVARIGWDRRHRIFNDLATHEELNQWKEDVPSFHKKIQVNRQLLEDRAKSLLIDLGLKEKQLRVAQRENPEVAKWIELQIANMHELSNAYAGSLVQVESAHRMLAKLEDSLTTQTNPTTASAWLEMLGLTAVAIWNYEVTSLDDRPITVRKIIGGLLLMLFGFFLSRKLSRFVGRRMLPRLGMNGGATTALQSISFYAMVTCFTFISLELVNVPLTVFTFLGGALAIGIGFGSQNIINNFISGLIILAEQPIRVGDLVDVAGLSGNVEKIGARSTRVKTGANLEIIVPNSKFLEDNVTNWTLSDTRTRTSVSVGVSYGSPTERVEELLKEAVSTCPDTLAEPEPIILFHEFGDNSLTFEIHFWIVMKTVMQARQIQSKVRHTIDRLFRDSEITIAFPQRDVHLDTLRPIEVNLRQMDESIRLPMQIKRAA